ncbi:MFS transporter [Phenylobacterium sp. LjRoot225]|uniref:MFS transporter n=1 Tax=Phenylobacterium sp. LjRoot225 TaxID=3342285 RepID=UPI003ECE37C0
MDEQRISWPAIIVVYLATVLSMAAVGVVAALTLDLATAFGVTKKAVGLALSIFSLPSAVAALLCGGIIDRFGPRRVILASCALAALADVAAVLFSSMPGLSFSLLLSGIGYTGIAVSAPVMFVAAATGGRRVRAMSLWSTYAPTGFAVGLLLAAPFAGSSRWMAPLLIHGGLMALAAVAAAVLLPSPPSLGRTSLKDQLRGFATVFAEAPVLRLALTAAIPCGLSYGTSLVAPAYLAEVHGVAMGESATGVAVVKGAAMALCGLATGALLARSPNIPRLFAGLAVLGVAAQVAVFWPGSSFGFAIVGLGAWLVAYGGITGVAMSLLPTVIRSPSQSGAASGLIGQTMSIFSFAAPTIYFGLQGWTGFVLLAGIGLAICVAALPVVWKRRTAAIA